MLKISKILLTFSISLLQINTITVFGQEPIKETETIVIGENTQPAIVYPFEMIVFDERDKQEYKVIVEDPVIVEQRLKTIQKSIPLAYNSNVKLWLDFFMIRRPSFTKKMLEDKDFFFPVFEKYLIASNMPEELKYLSLLESGLNPKAVSRSKAVGLWQFMSFTGKDMGLNINEYVDERMHIEKSTEAACKYLGQLYRKFGDWELALASYNTGPGRISRVIKSTGLSSYWDLHPHIHPDTRAYVPQFIALMYMMNYANDHGIYASNKKEFIPVEKIIISQYLNLKTFADLSHIDFEDLKTYNPHLKTQIIPDNLNGIDLSLPTEKLAYFNQYKQYILDSAGKRPVSSQVVAVATRVNDQKQDNSGFKTLEDGTIVIGSKSSVSVSDEIEEDIVKYKSVVKQVKKVHKVKRGEFLIKIADKYDVTLAELKRWNKLKKNQVNAGTKLIVYVNEKQKIKTIQKKSKSKVNEEANENEVIAKVNKDSKKTPKKKEVKEENDFVTHRVKKGDTLWNISQKYEGVTVSDIKKLNKISGNTVKVGQVIKIKS